LALVCFSTAGAPLPIGVASAVALKPSAPKAAAAASAIAVFFMILSSFDQSRRGLLSKRLPERIVPLPFPRVVADTGCLSLPG
jgi:hypothetical protein